jgi:ABC-2 type transport system permease protein
MSIWRITCKDLLVLAQDRMALVLLLILPLIFISIVGMSTGQFLTRDDSSDQFKIAIVDQSQTVTSENLISELKLRPDFLIMAVPSKEAASDAMRRGDSMATMIIGPKFEELVDDVRVGDLLNTKHGLAANGPGSLDLSIGTKMTSGGFGRLLETVLFTQVVRFVAPIAAQKNPIARAWTRSQEDEDEDSSSQAAIATPAAPTRRKAPNTVYLWVVPGFTVMFAFFLISIMARSFIIEREQGTLRRLLMAPTGTVSVLLGKTIPYYITSIVQCALLFLCGRVLFDMPWGAQPIYLVPVILCTSAAATALGLLLSTMVQTDQQVSAYGTTLILVFSGISGCFFPREYFPKAMKQISLFTPHAWSLKAFDAVLSQPVVEPQFIAGCCGMLLVFTFACFTIGWWRFRVTARG